MRWPRARSLVAAGASTGWTAFWAVGLLTPVSLYAVSFWEHTLGLAAMLWAIVWFVDVARRRRLARRLARVVVGALFGAAAMLRTEALVYFAVTLVAVLACLSCATGRGRARWRSGSRREPRWSRRWPANVALEIADHRCTVRAGRTAGAAGAAGAATLWTASDQATTFVGFNGFSTRSTGSWAG